MAIFGKDRAQQGARNGSTIVAAGTEFVGNLSLSDTLHLDGRIDGDVQSESNVVIGADGYFKGRIKAATVVVSGRVEGSIAADRLEIIAGGCVEGDVHTIDLVIEPGGRFNGSSEILAAENDAATHDAVSASKSSRSGSAKNKKPTESPTEEVGSTSTA
ncbi:MAG TPA: polymer-forming cytoskeletal protein [Wenzhouxiangellaceae bacterium]|nr:polymer-forming cytoskeletal protein [Wenzhouxiangellaceae bacterium]